METKQLSRWELKGDHAKLVIRAKELGIPVVRNGRLIPMGELADLVRRRTTT